VPRDWTFYEHPGEYQGEPSVRIACTQRTDQAKLVRAWADALPKLTDLREIDFCSRFPNALIQPVAQMAWLEKLRIKWSGLTSIEAWGSLTSLREFCLGSSPSLADPQTVLKWPHLKLVTFDNVRANFDTEWMSDLRNLSVLGINGSWSTSQIIKTLWPLQGLGLETLVLINTRIVDKDSLFVCAQMKKLKTLHTAYRWPRGSLERLSEMRKDLTINGMTWPNFVSPV